MLLLTILFIVLAVYFAKKGNDKDTSLGKAAFMSGGITIIVSFITFGVMMPFTKTEKVTLKKVVLLDNPGKEYFIVNEEGDTIRDDHSMRNLDNIFLDEESDSSYIRNHYIDYSDKTPDWLEKAVFDISDNIRIREDLYLCKEDWKRYTEARKANN